MYLTIIKNCRTYNSITTIIYVYSVCCLLFLASKYKVENELNRCKTSLIPN